jgi:acyl carrier protein
MLIRTDITDKIRTFVLNYFVKDSGLAFKDDTSLLEEGIIDSTGVMELVAFLEETFEFRVEDEEIVPDTFDSVNRIVKYVHSKLADKLSGSTPNPGA